MSIKSRYSHELLDRIFRYFMRIVLHLQSSGIEKLPLENNFEEPLKSFIDIAVGQIRNVQYIVLDEGTSALDEANALDIENNLLNTPQLGVIIITHNLRDSIREQLTAVYQL